MQRARSTCKVVVFAATENEDVLIAIRLGGRGVFLKDTALRLLVECKLEFARRKALRKGAHTAFALEHVADKLAISGGTQNCTCITSIRSSTLRGRVDLVRYLQRLGVD
jgi:hypothetical protein